MRYNSLLRREIGTIYECVCCAIPSIRSAPYKFEERVKSKGVIWSQRGTASFRSSRDEMVDRDIWDGDTVAKFPCIAFED